MLPKSFYQMASHREREEEEEDERIKQEALDLEIAAAAEKAAKEAERAQEEKEKREKESKTQFQHKRERERYPETMKTPGTRAGSYFGESEREKKNAEKNSEQAQKAKETDKISSLAGNRRREIEKKLSSQVRTRAADAAARKREKENELAKWEARAKIGRRLAAPVERALRAYYAPPPSFSFYRVLGVSRDADSDTIKKAHREAALRIHPGRDLFTLTNMCFHVYSSLYSTNESTAFYLLLFHFCLKKDTECIFQNLHVFV